MKRLILIIGLFFSSLAYGTDPVIYIVIHEYHSGIVFNKSDIQMDYLANADFYDDAGYIEIGFGDEKFYMADEIDVITGTRALLFPTKSVLHVVKFSLPPKITFPKGNIYPLSLTQDQLQLLLNYVKNAFLAKDNVIAPIGESLYLEGSFYHARESFHFFNTCNTWVAEGLKQAGLDVSSSGVTTQEALTKQMEKLEKKSNGAVPFDPSRL